LRAFAALAERLPRRVKGMALGLIAAASFTLLHASVPRIVPGRTQLHQQLVARERLGLDRLQALDVAAQPLAPHAAFLANACIAAGQHVHVLLGGQLLDLHAVAHLRPGFVQERLLQLGQPPLGRAHQVARPHLPHLGQAVLRRDAAVHRVAQVTGGGLRSLSLPARSTGPIPRGLHHCQLQDLA